MNYDIVVVGSINMDIIVEAPKYPAYGDTMFCDSIKMLPGGKGANQAVSVAKLGKKTCLVGSVGKDSAGNQLIENLQSKNVDTSYIVQSEASGTGTFVAIVDSSGENTMVGTKGANDSLSKEDIEKIFAQIDAKILLVQLETSKESIIAAMQAAKERGMYVILDPAPADGIFEEAFQYADLVTPNKQETKRITGIDVINKETALEAAKKLNEKGISDVIVKMGEHGSLVYKNGEATVVDAIKVKAVDTVGAGDCFAGALASAYLDTNDLVKAANFASVAAGIKVSRSGGQEAIPTLSEVEGYLVK
ncbi:PfkB domain-containing protein [Niallia circulans]|uniref:ribokinase n=1 Tax=Niallia circulans TaxID=1397 RepID=UPI00077CA50E|nr:ribokinase [Niallia circulans]MDR4317664.1 ribokinase [Niallia circulans]MED3841201.1 ribokinase [Niallia circulans]MED4245778.1 ribokinase [Niallia circulans]MED4247640.1 ribokinase [Niallia circulans]QKH63334.1 ribokinase [Niallia circulans]